MPQCPPLWPGLQAATSVIQAEVPATEPDAVAGVQVAADGHLQQFAASPTWLFGALQPQVIEHHGVVLRRSSTGSVLAAG
jgi:hypothetical protein